MRSTFLIASLLLCSFVANAGQSVESALRDVTEVVVDVQVGVAGAGDYPELESSLRAELIGWITQLGYRVVSSSQPSGVVPLLTLNLRVFSKPTVPAHAVSAELCLYSRASLLSHPNVQLMAPLFKQSVQTVINPGDETEIRKVARFLLARLLEASGKIEAIDE